MTSNLDTDWTAHARRLADTLRNNGDLRSPLWHAAVSAVPRHLLVPRAYQQDDTGAWSQFETAAALERVYSPETLVTALETVGDKQFPISSSTKPDLMVRMLEILDVHNGQRVLEIGTGTGYNAALLTHRLGNEQVFSVDVDDDLVSLARKRLDAAGFRPTLVAVDGVHGLPEHAPFDRIIATCSVPAVPWEWAEQLAPDGTILVDLKLATSAGNLVHLRRTDDRLEGNFTTRWAAFMAMRTGTSPEPLAHADHAPGGRTRPTNAPATPWSEATVAWFLAHLRLPPGTSFGYDLDPDTRQPVATTFSAPDGSWARVSLTDRTVTETGDTPLWSEVEWAYEQWTAAGQPPWDRLGLTVAPDGTHQVWVDNPNSSHRWLLPAASK
nr:methyltransferase domain-containing protein [Kibdelosporangium sp. MJ126-NF4]CEL18545.1 Protein-L-isoaspartate O-methyltransferase [Kibdelosporangium sp. MJ126-NF4]CTQ98029.1 Protein-L-isoaspartate O-methyltransferase (EC 2.1.1.77) [Kibdelosporangium sp. MJ126-NF4]